MRPGDNNDKAHFPRKLHQTADNRPLRERLPKFDEDGRRLNDFMVLIPGLNKHKGKAFESKLDTLHSLLGETEEVVFADLNLPLNLLWISIKSGAGVITGLADKIRSQIPEARLVGHIVLSEEKQTKSEHRQIETTDRQRIKHEN